MPPYNEKQRKLFQAAAHNKDIAERHHMSQDQARKLMDEDKRIEQNKNKRKGK